MNPCCVFAILFLLSAATADAAEPLTRKPGLWEVRTRIDSSNAPPLMVRQCIDAATDQALQSIAGPIDPAVCAQRSVQPGAQATTVDFKCSIGGKAATAHAVITGSFEDAYTLTVTAQGAAIAGGSLSMTMEGKWLGPCAADQRPGDVIMSNGMKINLPEMQKRVAPADQPAPR